MFLYFAVIFVNFLDLLLYNLDLFVVRVEVDQLCGIVDFLFAESNVLDNERVGIFSHWCFLNIDNISRLFALILNTILLLLDALFEISARHFSLNMAPEACR